VPERSINLTFHGIGTPSRPLEPDEGHLWVSPEQFVALLDCASRRDEIAITFDDGNASDVEQALPALQERGLTATFFLVADRIGTPHFLDEEGVRALAAAGMEIGCHGMRHRPWRSLDGPSLHEELVEAKSVLERLTGRPITRAACPFGAYDRRVVRAARGSGYQQLFTSDRGLARSGTFVQARNSVGSEDDAAIFDRIAQVDSSRSKAAVRRAKLAIKRWR
jgi:peptidoglycan/xylan/chitin deacetylase (PgdA/CDA1 family)